MPGTPEGGSQPSQSEAETRAAANHAIKQADRDDPRSTAAEAALQRVLRKLEGQSR